MSASIHTIDLSKNTCVAPLLTQRFLDLVTEYISQGQHVVVIHNRRGHDRILKCGDCGHIWKCVWCDVPLVSYTTPKKHLKCHCCHSPFEMPSECPHCHSQTIKPGMPGTEGLESSLAKLLPELAIIRLESDVSQSSKSFKRTLKHTETPTLFIATHIEQCEYLPEIRAVLYPLLEADFILGKYDTQERLFEEISFLQQSNIDVIFQTYLSQEGYIEMLRSHQTKDFVSDLLRERKLYHLPPYSLYAELQITQRDEQSCLGLMTLYKERILEMKTAHGHSELHVVAAPYTKKIGREYRASILLR